MGSLIPPPAKTGSAPPQLGGAPAPHAANKPPEPRTPTPAAEKALRFAWRRAEAAVSEASREWDALRDVHARLRRRLPPETPWRDPRLVLLTEECEAAGWRWWRMETARRAAAEALGIGARGGSQGWIARYQHIFPAPAWEAEPVVVLAVA